MISGSPAQPRTLEELAKLPINSETEQCLLYRQKIASLTPDDATARTLGGKDGVFSLRCH